MKPSMYLLKASHLTPFIKVMESHELPVEELLHRAGLSRKNLDDDENLIFESKVWELIALASEYEGMENLGFITTQTTPLSDYGTFFDELLNQKNLKTMLNYFVKHMNMQSNCLTYWLSEHKGYFWICRPGTPLLTRGAWQVEQHVMSLIVKLIRAFIGPKWSPTRIGIQSIVDTGIDQFDFFKDTVILPGQKFSSIPVELKYLTKKPLITALAITTKAQNIPDSFVTSLKRLLKQHYFGDEWSAIVIASGLNMSVSTLKRKLASYNTTLREVIDEVRFSQAKALLKKAKINNDKIAKELGYQYTPNFVRAFKRWSGISPTAYQASLGKTKVS
ncbi:helix-turn-helix domain-containing protein [Thalassotalea psychrophila]|uniref:Helix-turn-helix domain-containing protein n=1 Tax=Thalassotalea psychrophila TaxID=3065647 RepID=A0ABY9TXN0_9GAMM|nr:helix-turn-helix domain-containing protein [Colwelliaceae bacterium SQ149]